MTITSDDYIVTFTGRDFVWDGPSGYQTRFQSEVDALSVSAGDDAGDVAGGVLDIRNVGFGGTTGVMPRSSANRRVSSPSQARSMVMLAPCGGDGPRSGKARHLQPFSATKRMALITVRFETRTFPR